MGLGDEILGSSLARGFAERGKRAAFGDGNRIIWSSAAHEIYRNNPNVARPDQDNTGYELEWIKHYVGNRLYGDCVNGKWRFRDCVWEPGELFLSKGEKEWALARAWQHTPIVVLEPRVKSKGACDGRNKQWPVSSYDNLAAALRWDKGIERVRVVQFVPPEAKPLLKWAEPIITPNFRYAAALLGLAALYIGPEGGLHHAAAAVGTPAVVIFGGFNTPRSTGYSWHENITVGEPCGSVTYCSHCEQAMRSITVNQVLRAARRQMQEAV